MKHIACLALLLASIVVSGSACSSDETCSGDRCACTAEDDCTISCDSDDCVIAGAPGHATEVECNGAADCRVSCQQSTSCDVDCGGVACTITCPPSGCTVTSVGPGSVIACGAGGVATMSGTTATCP